jgi:hypothetical protein
MMPAATAAEAITPMMASQTGRSECSSRGGEEDIFPEGIFLIAALSAVFCRNSPLSPLHVILRHGW